MNKDIETRLKELQLKFPDTELEAKILSSANKAWNECEGRPVKIIPFRKALAIAASLILLAGILAVLNIAENKKMQQAMISYPKSGLQKSENISLLEEMGLGKEYSKLIACLSSEHKTISTMPLLDRKLKL